MRSKTLSGMLYRDGKLFLVSLWRALLLCALFALLCGALLYTSLTSIRKDTETPITVALVDEDGSFVSQIALNFIKNQKDVASVAGIQQTDYEGALVGVENGEYSGAIILPKDYLNAIMAGDLVRGKVLLPNGTFVDTSLLRRVASTGESLIRMGQYGVFAGASAVSKDPQTREIYDLYLVKINDSLLYEASTGNERYITKEITSYASSSLPLTEHMVLLMLLSLASLSTLFFYRAQTADLSPALTSRLRASGIGPAAFLLPKILYSFLFRILLCGSLLLLLSRLFALTLSPLTLLLFLVALLLSSALDTLLSVSLAGNRFGIALLSLFFLTQMFFAGGILPLHYLAEPLCAIGRCLPLGLSFRLSASLFGASASPLSLAPLTLWLIPLLALAVRRLHKLCTEGGKAL